MLFILRLRGTGNGLPLYEKKSVSIETYKEVHGFSVKV
ncbi:hypothetical protein BC059799_2998 [Bacillus cereus NVH0597-99]|nr:hypothetical protein BC059799_2998 [Bacillus cereus NVH0597-99]